MSSGGKIGDRRPLRTPCEADGSRGVRGRRGGLLVDARRLVVGVAAGGRGGRRRRLGRGRGDAGRRHRHQRLGPLQGRPRHHPRLVGPLRLGLDPVQGRPWSRAATPGRRRPARPSPWGPGSISIVVIGGISYVKGNADGLENLAGLSSPQATEAAGQWIEFSTDNAAFAPVVARGALHGPGQGAGPEGPALPRPRRARSTARRSTPSTGPRPSARRPSTSSSTSAPREPTFPWRRTR